MNLTPIPANLCTELRIKYVRKESTATIVSRRLRKRFSYLSVENAHVRCRALLAGHTKCAAKACHEKANHLSKTFDRRRCQLSDTSVC